MERSAASARRPGRRHGSRLLALLSAAGIATLAAALAPGAALHAQRVERRGTGEPALDRRLDALLRAGDYLLVTEDTLIAAQDSVPRSVLVLDAVLILEGAVAGDLAAVDANVFLRPGARVHGAVINAGGGLYRSELATLRGDTVNAPLASYQVVRRPGVAIIVARTERRALELDGLFGFHPPTYDRVDALGLTWGASYALPAVGASRPSIRGRASYRSGRGALNGGAELAVERGRNTLLAGAEEVTATNDAWIRDDLRNSLAFLVAGNDYRNYYEAERWYAQLGRRFGRGSSTLEAAVRGQTERAESLGAGDPWVLFGDAVRPNPPIDDGRINSLLVLAAGEWLGSSAAAEGEASLEFAGDAFGGDFSFARFEIQGEWAMQALAEHVLEVEVYFQGPLPGTDALPLQRWSFVGGGGTLSTFEIGEFPGDRVVFVKSTYIIPLPRRWRLPLLGVPGLEIRHAVGMAWSEGIERDLEQNIGLRLQFFGPYLRVVTNPDDPVDDIELDVGLSWPFGDDRPWQHR